MRSPPNVGNINYYHDHFRSAAQNFRAEPRVDRSCNDKCCYVLFILITIAFVVTGIYLMSQANFQEAYNNIKQDSSFQSNKNFETSQIQIQNLKGSIPVIAGMIILAMIISLVFLFLLIKFPKPMFYAMCILAAALMIAVAIAFFIAQVIVAGITILVILSIYACVFFCVRNHIQQGIVLLQVASKFIASRPSIFLAPIFMMIFIAIFQIFWLGGIIGISLMKIQAQTEEQIQTQQSIRGTTYFFWMVFQIFYSTFFYYCMVFIVATGCAMWYYNIEGFYLCTAVCRIIKFHVGSFTFAAILVTLITMARQQAQNQSRESGGALAICLCCLACCLKLIEDLLETLNHNAIIVMSVTGQSYFDSAKSTLSLIFENFSLFFVVDIISGLVRFTGSVLICGIPTLIGFFLLTSTMENPDDYFTITVSVVAILFASLLIGGLVLGLLSEALNCVFIFYCFDLKFQSMGFNIANQVQPEMRKLFNDIQSQEGYQQPPPQYNDYNNGYNQPPNNNYSPNNSYQPQSNYYQPQSNYYQGGGNPSSHNSGYPSLNKQPMGPYGYQ